MQGRRIILVVGGVPGSGKTLLRTRVAAWPPSFLQMISKFKTSVRTGCGEDLEAEPISWKRFLLMEQDPGFITYRFGGQGYALSIETVCRGLRMALVTLVTTHDSAVVREIARAFPEAHVVSVFVHVDRLIARQRLAPNGKVTVEQATRLDRADELWETFDPRVWTESIINHSSLQSFGDLVDDLLRRCLMAATVERHCLCCHIGNPRNAIEALGEVDQLQLAFPNAPEEEISHVFQ